MRSLQNRKRSVFAAFFPQSASPDPRTDIPLIKNESRRPFRAVPALVLHADHSSFSFPSASDGVPSTTRFATPTIQTLSSAMYSDGERF